MNQHIEPREEYYEFETICVSKFLEENPDDGCEEAFLPFSEQVRLVTLHHNKLGIEYAESFVMIGEERCDFIGVKTEFSDTLLCLVVRVSSGRLRLWEITTMHTVNGASQEEAAQIANKFVERAKKGRKNAWIP